jgi:hypothetical protein
MRRLHVHGDEQIAALFQLPRRFADDANDLNFTADRLAAIRARTWLVAGELASSIRSSSPLSWSMAFRSASRGSYPAAGIPPSSAVRAKSS